MFSSIDIAPAFVQFAQETERSQPQHIHYAAASALQLPFPASAFDFITANMSLEQVAEPKADAETIRRVPAVADTRVVAYFLHIRCRKP